MGRGGRVLKNDLHQPTSRSFLHALIPKTLEVSDNGELVPIVICLWQARCAAYEVAFLLLPFHDFVSIVNTVQDPRLP
jgi:hypothetical protein